MTDMHSHGTVSYWQYNWNLCCLNGLFSTAKQTKNNVYQTNTTNFMINVSFMILILQKLKYCSFLTQHPNSKDLLNI